MDPYTPPEADLNTPQNASHRPIRATVYCLLIAIVASSIASTILATVYAIALNVNIEDQGAFEASLSGSTTFMLLDLVLTATFLYLGGRTAAAYVRGQEHRWGLILSALTFGLFWLLFNLADAFSVWPFWYNFSCLLAVSGIYFGARSVESVQAPDSSG